ncbi:MAG TPA: M28 family peptidase [Bryobacteraceae bacterium]|nr:M28 family peptidase [Bryobacteraceae bacterium]
MRFLPLLLLGASLLAAQEKSMDPRVREIVDGVSDQRIEATIRKLAGFGTRNTLSSQGNEAARQWISSELQSYSPRLQVTLEHFKVKKNADRIFRDVDLYNVVAVLPGAAMPDTRIVISGHYDSLNLVRLPGQSASEAVDNLAERSRYDWTKVEVPAPGANDDASGTAAVMELARVMSLRQFPKTLVFIAFAGEEQGLIGSSLHAAQARKQGRIIEAVLNNDIIGGEISGNGRMGNSAVSLYSDEIMDSVSRELALYARRVGERYLPSMKINTIFMQDRLGRGGDHTPFQWEGYAAVRFSSPYENYAHQHSETDLLSNMSVPYTTRVARINAAVAASLALAPKPPAVTSEGRSGVFKGMPVPMITRGKSRYDAQLKWKPAGPEDRPMGYSIVMRPTTAPDWEREIYVGSVNEYILKDVSIDDVRFGVKAIGPGGEESLVSPYVFPPRPKREIPVY